MMSSQDQNLFPTCIQHQTTSCFDYHNDSDRWACDWKPCFNHPIFHWYFLTNTTSTPHGHPLWPLQQWWLAPIAINQFDMQWQLVKYDCEWTTAGEWHSLVNCKSWNRNIWQHGMWTDVCIQGRQYTFPEIAWNAREVRKMKCIAGHFTHVLQNSTKCEKRKVYSGVFCVTFLFRTILHQGRHSRETSKRFHSLFFHRHEIWMKYKKCIVGDLYFVACFAKTLTSLAWGRPLKNVWTSWHELVTTETLLDGWIQPKITRGEIWRVWRMRWQFNIGVFEPLWHQLLSMEIRIILVQDPLVLQFWVSLINMPLENFKTSGNIPCWRSSLEARSADKEGIGGQRTWLAWHCPPTSAA